MQEQTNSNSISIAEATNRLRQFVKERDWEQFHTPRNLVMALVGEVGEVAEIFQWKGQVAARLPQFTEEEKKHVGQELADVFSYLIRLSDVCGVDLSEAFANKMQKNAKKYPAQMVKGSAKKYTEYKHHWNEQQQPKKDNNNN